MCNLTKREDLSSFKDSLKNTSYDRNNNAWMLSDEIEVICIDDVADSYTSRCGISSVDSVDALHFCDGKGNVFIEFKNGKLDKADIYEVMKKIYDTLLIISDVTKWTISDFRENTDFVLVYNEEKNPSLFNEIPAPSNSSALRKMTESMYGKAKTAFKIEGLYAFEAYCFKTVELMSVTQFRHVYLN